MPWVRWRRTHVISLPILRHQGRKLLVGNLSFSGCCCPSPPPNKPTVVYRQGYQAHRSGNPNPNSDLLARIQELPWQTEGSCRYRDDVRLLGFEADLDRRGCVVPDLVYSREFLIAICQGRCGFGVGEAVISLGASIAPTIFVGINNTHREKKKKKVRGEHLHRTADIRRFYALFAR